MFSVLLKTKPVILHTLKCCSANAFSLDKFENLSSSKSYTMCLSFNPLPDDEILDRFKLKQSADVDFEFDENSRKFSKWVENTVGKGEIAHHEQFLVFPQCFQKACFPVASKVSLCGNGLSHKSLIQDCYQWPVQKKHVA